MAKTLQEKIAVMQAAAEGKTIQTRYHSSTADWRDCSPLWDWDAYDYRVKPREPREFWINKPITTKGICCYIYDTEDSARSKTISRGGYSLDFETIHVREVIQDDPMYTTLCPEEK